MRVLPGSKVYLFSGTRDSVVYTVVMEAVEKQV